MSHIILCNFGGRIMRAFDAIEGASGDPGELEVSYFADFFLLHKHLFTLRSSFLLRIPRSKRVLRVKWNKFQ